jgi:arginyl-tRNA synthetase
LVLTEGAQGFSHRSPRGERVGVNVNEMRSKWQRAVAAALNSYKSSRNIAADEISADSVAVEIPPRPELGDFAFPMFPYARTFRSAPAAIAAAVRDLLDAGGSAGGLGKAVALGPYLNVSVERSEVISSTLKTAVEEDGAYGRSDLLSGQKAMVEFSSPNTNKPLHLGHLRNDALGESVARLLAAAGAEVRKVNIVNNRGIHICKSMLAYMKTGGGRTPQSEGMKGDHFVGSYYVSFSEYARQHPEAEAEAQELLRKWEAGDQETVALWARMNDWTVSGIWETYARTGIAFDAIYYENDTYLRGRDEVLKGLESGVFYRETDGSVWVDLTEIGLDRKVLLRKDGTSLYVTQDIGTAIVRHRDWPFDRLIFVVASEQQYHFKVLFHVLAKLGYSWAKNLFHLSYGMVNLPEGKMKSREGTVVDADDLIDGLKSLAKEEILAKGRELDVGDLEGTAEKIAIGALHYYLLQATPSKDMLFNPRESLSFNGNTGPYLQYMGARICSMLRKRDESPREKRGAFRPELLRGEEEWELVKLVLSFPSRIEEACREMNPSLITSLLYDLAKLFSRYYHDHPIITNDDPDLNETRLMLARGILRVFREGFVLINVPFLEAM